MKPRADVTTADRPRVGVRIGANGLGLRVRAAAGRGAASEWRRGWRM